MAKILVVDDDLGVANLCKMILDQCGYHVSFATTRSEFLTLIQNEKFELLITDMRMPDMHGIECSEKIREIYPDTGIIIMTGSSDWNEKESAWIRNSQNRVIFKPFKPKEFEEVIKSYLKSHDGD